MKIAIAGAGIGGLAAASLLIDAGHSVTIFDKFDAPRPVGSGLVIQPVGQAVLHRIGVRDAALAKGAPVRRMVGQTDQGRQVLNVSYDIAGDGVFGLGIHRSGVFDVLLTAAQKRGATLVPGFCVVDRVDQCLVAENGRTTQPFDLIVDALGAHSPLSPLRSRPLPFGAVWGTVDWPDTDLHDNQLSQTYQAARHMMGVMPCGLGKAAIFWSLPRGQDAAFRKDGLAAWQDKTTALWPAFEPFARQITDLDQLSFAQYSHGTLRRMWATGIVHIGDAAHRTSPQLGQGANMALLDAAALAHAMAQAQGNQALKLYLSLRRHHIALYQSMSWLFTPMYQSHNRWLPMARDWVLYPTSQVPPVPRLLTRVVRGDVISPLGRIKQR
ncbi:MAG: NAD(P)/FAD-dependent oxidoreductase [Pseudomonadota bacterium]